MSAVDLENSRRRGREESPLFRPTRWSLVARAGGSDAATAREALETLCAAYWFPLYAWTRRRGHGPEDAEDLVQSFFAQVAEGKLFQTATPEKGRLRTYLIGAMRQHLADAARYRGAVKRGGKAAHFSLDDAERRLALEPADADTPETLYHRCWARAVLARALTVLENAETARGGAEAFALLKPALSEPTALALDPDAAAAALGIPRDQVKVRVHRLRRRFRQAVLEVIGETLPARSREAREEEMRDLLAALGG